MVHRLLRLRYFPVLGPLLSFVGSRCVQDLDNHPIEPEEGMGQLVGQMRCRNRLSETMKYVYRDAA